MPGHSLIIVKHPHREKIYVYLNEEDAKTFNPPHSYEKKHIASFYFKMGNGQVIHPIIKVKDKAYENQTTPLIETIAKYFNGSTPRQYMPLQIHVTVEEFISPAFARVLSLKKMLKI